MQKLLLGAGLLLVLALAGCSSRTISEEPPSQNSNTETTVAPSEISDADLALAEGNKFLDTGETDKAIDALNQAVKLNPDLAEAWFKLGIAFALAEKRDESLEKTETEAPAANKKPAKPNSVKAFDKAVAAYKKIISANDEDHVAYFNLGRAYNKLNEDEDAAKALKQAVKINPEDTEYQTELGAILIKLAQYHEAIAPLKKAVELDPDNIRAQELLEDAEAGRSRVNYASTPKEEKKKPADNTNSNAASTHSNVKVPPPLPSPAFPRPRPTPSRSPGN
ncbi:MAG TPA: tetratricopeptide repeat protein [Pyrinomonadaceae bacterium]|nr:tetratricopeptide repeat protein [Pyrinomonadaceae bacterium]